MNQLPKLKDFPTPDGYFDRLPDQILAKSKISNVHSWIRYGAAAAVLLCLGISWQMGLFTPEVQPLSLEEEANLYIESQIWTAEDILSLSENPNEILDQIIEEEMPSSEELWDEDELNWF